MSALEDLVVVILWLAEKSNKTPPADAEEALERLKRRITNGSDKNSD